MSDHKIFISSILAGVAISIGATVNLMVENKVIGAVLFSLGIIIVKHYKLLLFTGKIAYFFDSAQLKSFGLTKIDFLVIWIGNLCGAFATSMMLWLTKNGVALHDKASLVFYAKTNDSIISLFFLGIFCNILVYIAVVKYEDSRDMIISILAITIFILCGFEHCVADMSYAALGSWFTVDNMLSALRVIIIVTAGNMAGAIGFHELIRKTR